MIRIIIAIIAASLAGGIFFFYTQPAYDQMQATQAQITEYNAALDKAAELQQLKQTLLSRYNAFSPASLTNLQKLLPDNVDNVGLILDLDNLASHYGLALENVDVSSSNTQTASNQTAISAIGAVGTSNQKYASLTLAFGTRGTYPNFVQFMADLESSLRILDLVSLSITSESAAAPASGVHAASSAEPIYDYNITLRTYWLK